MVRNVNDWCSMKPDTNLKNGRAYRVHTPRERQQQIIAEWSRSGVSVPRFAETIGVKYQTLATWIRNHGGSRAARVQEAPPRWLEMAVAAPTTPSTGLRVELPGGATIVVSDAAQLPLVIQLLRALS